MRNPRKLTGVERFFDQNEIIVSKTDLKGIITYGNRTFVKLSGYSEGELIGAPHNVLRHEDMPRCVFKLLWDTLKSGNEIFAYVVNKSKNGDHYWVFAHVTASRNAAGETVGYHSTRRVPNFNVVKSTVVPLYQKLLKIERDHESPKRGLEASSAALADLLREKGMTYEELVFSLQR